MSAVKENGEPLISSMEETQCTQDLGKWLFMCKLADLQDVHKWINEDVVCNYNKVKKDNYDDDAQQNNELQRLPHAPPLHC